MLGFGTARSAGSITPRNRTRRRRLSARAEPVGATCSARSTSGRWAMATGTCTARSTNGSSRGATHSSAAFRRRSARIYLLMHGGPAVNGSAGLKLPLVLTEIPANPPSRSPGSCRLAAARTCRATARRRTRQATRTSIEWRRPDDIGGKAERAVAERFIAHPSKPFAFPEWGLWGLDDPAFVNDGRPSRRTAVRR